MKKILIVTDANGFLGTNLLRELEMLDYEYEVRAVVLQDSDISKIRHINADIYYGDITEYETLDKVFSYEEGDEITVVHLGSFISMTGETNENVYAINVRGTVNIISKCLETNARLIYLSSTQAIPPIPDGGKIVEPSFFDPVLADGIYAKTKSQASYYIQNAIKERGLEAMMLFPSVIIGPMDVSRGYMTQLTVMMSNGFRLVADGGYDFVDVRDVVGAIVSSVLHFKPGEMYILSGSYVSVESYYNLVSKHVGIKKKALVIPSIIAKIVVSIIAYFLKKFRNKEFVNTISIDVLEHNSNFCNDKARMELGFDPRPIDITIKDILKWLKSEKIE